MDAAKMRLIEAEIDFKGGTILRLVAENRNLFGKKRANSGKKGRARVRSNRRGARQTGFQLDFTGDRESVKLLKKLFGRNIKLDIDSGLLDLLDLAVELKDSNLAKSTGRAYFRYNKRFLEWCGKRPAEVDINDINGFFNFFTARQSVSFSAINQAYSALKFYYDRILMRDFFIHLARPRIKKISPVVLSKSETRGIIEAPRRIEERALLELLYSSGFKAGEAVLLKTDGIDLKRKIVVIRDKKGDIKKRGKLSAEGARILREIVDDLRDKKSSAWLFTLPGRSNHISPRTVGRIIARAGRDAGRDDAVNINMLQRAFAVHRLEEEQRRKKRRPSRNRASKKKGKKHAKGGSDR